MAAAASALGSCACGAAAAARFRRGTATSSSSSCRSASVFLLRLLRSGGGGTSPTLPDPQELRQAPPSAPGRTWPGSRRGSGLALPFGRAGGGGGARAPVPDFLAFAFVASGKRGAVYVLPRSQRRGTQGGSPANFPPASQAGRQTDALPNKNVKKKIKGGGWLGGLRRATGTAQSNRRAAPGAICCARANSGEPLRQPLGFCLAPAQDS